MLNYATQLFLLEIGAITLYYRVTGITTYFY